MSYNWFERNHAPRFRRYNSRYQHCFLSNKSPKCQIRRITGIVQKMLFTNDDNVRKGINQIIKNPSTVEPESCTNVPLLVPFGKSNDIIRLNKHVNVWFIDHDKYVYNYKLHRNMKNDYVSLWWIWEFNSIVEYINWKINLTKDYLYFDEELVRKARIIATGPIIVRATYEQMQQLVRSDNEFFEHADSTEYQSHSMQKLQVQIRHSDIQNFCIKTKLLSIDSNIQKKINNDYRLRPDFLGFVHHYWMTIGTHCEAEFEKICYLEKLLGRKHLLTFFLEHYIFSDIH